MSFVLNKILSMENYLITLKYLLFVKIIEFYSIVIKFSMNS